MSCNFLFEALETVEMKEIFEEHWSNSRIPLGGGIELTFKCNLSCVHCYAASGRSCPDLTFEEIKNIVDQLASEGTLFLYLTGGEVLTRKDFPEIYKYIRMKGIMVEILTNATLIDDKIIDLFVNYPPLKVDITIYGMTEETYEKVTRVKGSYKKFMTAIKKLKESNIPFELKTVVLTVNKDEVFLMKKFAEDMGIAFRYSFNISPMMNGDSSTIQYRISPEEAIKFDYMDPDRKYFWSCMKNKPNTSLESFREGDSYRVYLCRAGKNSFLIDASGKLYACVRERCHGYDVLSGTFKDGWNNYIMCNIRKRTASPDYPCVKCEHLKYCDHCPADFELENGSPDIPSSFRCQVARMRTEVFE